VTARPLEARYYTSVESFLPHLNLGSKLTTKYLMTLPSSATAVKISSTGKQCLLPVIREE